MLNPTTDPRRMLEAVAEAVLLEERRFAPAARLLLLRPPPILNLALSLCILHSP